MSSSSDRRKKAAATARKKRSAKASERRSKLSKSSSKSKMGNKSSSSSSKKKTSSSSSSSSSRSSSGNRSSNDPNKYPYSYGGKSYQNKADATAAAKATPNQRTTEKQFDQTDVQQSDADFEKKYGVSREEFDNNQQKSQAQGSGSYNSSDLKKTPEFRAMSKEDQEVALLIFGAIASGDEIQAKRFIEGFEAYAKMNDPYFASQLRMASDAIQRGYVAIDKEAEFAENQIIKRQDDLEQDYQSKKEFLSLEQASAMREVQRSYGQNLDNLQTNMAATGFTQSSRRAKKRGILDEATGDLRESKNRAFNYQQTQSDNSLARSTRDNASETARLKRVTEENKLDFLRTKEAKVGTANLPDLGGDAPAPLGDIYGSIPEQKLQNSISAAQSFIF